VIGVQVADDNPVELGQVDVSLQRAEGAAAEVEQQVRRPAVVLGLHEVTGGR
jgi:hypothetical protein